MTNLWDCEFYNKCKNNERCLSCGPTQRLLKLDSDKARTSSRGKIRSNAITPINDNSGVTLEEYVRDTFNSLPTVKEYQARRQLGSGNIWFMPGDVADTVILAECKERLTANSKGEKTMTIPKSMLEKIAKESETYGTYPALAFRYKGDETGNTYFVQNFDTLSEMVHEIKYLRHENQEKDAEAKMYKEVSEKLYKELQRVKGEQGNGSDK